MGFFANFWSWLNAQLATYIGVKVAAVALVLTAFVTTKTRGVRGGWLVNGVGCPGENGEGLSLTYTR